MHNSQNGAAMNFNATGTGPGTAVGTGYDDLLLFQNKNDVCLNCHAGNDGYHVWADDVLAPGQEHGAGNFVFLEEDNINDGHGGGSIVGCDLDFDNQTDCEDNGGVWDPGWANPIPGASAGHTIVSGIMGNSPDMELTAAPGGGATPYQASDLTCVSCHDPHGNQGFRLTYVNGQSMTDAGSGTTNWTATIDADGIGLFGPTATETDTNHNAYRSGYSDWCGTCHGDFHQASGSDIHPAGETLGADIALNYNLYDGTTDCLANPPAGGNPCGSGTRASAYLAMVPIEDPAGTTGTSSTYGANSTSRVACVTCHRAHATSAPDAGRWDFNVTGLAEDGHESGSYTLPNPYDSGQRSLCNKCHSQDEFDAPHDFTP
jgi:hypothetical protein